MESSPNPRIGDILIQSGLATASDIEQALEIALRDNLRLGEALIRMGIIDQDKITWALRVQFSLSYVDLDPAMIDWDLLASLPIEELRAVLLLPMALIDGKVHAVIADPTRRDLILDTLERLFGAREAVMELAAPDRITAMLNEAALRKNDPMRAHRPEGWDAALVTTWLEAVGSGPCNRVAIFPDSEGHGLFRSLSDPLIEGLNQSLTETDLDRICMILGSQCIAETQFQGGWSGIRSSRGFALQRPLRLLVLGGPGGRLVGIAPIPAHPSHGQGSFPTVITGSDPREIKSALHAAASSRPHTLAMEVRSDFFSPGLFQCEMSDPMQRRTAALQASSTLGTGLILFECGALAELEALHAEPEVNQRWIIHPRETSDPPPPLPPGWVNAGIPDISEILRKAGAGA